MKNAWPMLKQLHIMIAIAVVAATSGFSQMRGGGRGGLDNSLSVFTTDSFSGSGNCALCHSSRTDTTGHDVSMDRQWRSTMMANSAKDPLWQAKISSEVTRNPELRGVIEEKCSRCHMPMARVQAVAHGTPVTVLDDGFLNQTHYLHDAAMDGVSCSLCHQISAIDLGTPESFTGNYVVDTDLSTPYRWIYGSFAQPFQNPMQMNVGFTPRQGTHVNNSAYCGVCHTLYTPIVALNGDILGEFPEQTPYLEWKHSAYSKSDEVQHCQDCHMPVGEGSVALSNRPPWLSLRENLGQHIFVGGNSLLLDIFDANGAELGITAETAHLRATSELTKDQLRSQTAELAILSETVDQGVLTAVLQVTNLTGHKFPTGVPIRRAWIHALANDSQGQVVFESGAPGSDGQIEGNEAENNAMTYEPHYDLITTEDQVQIYETIMYDSEGEVTYTFLNAAGYLKDNRLLPDGFDKASADSDVAVYGEADMDGNFLGGTDIITYQIDVSHVKLPVSLRARILYQPIGYRFMADLRQDTTPQVESFSGYYDGADKSPIEVASIP